MLRDRGIEVITDTGWQLEVNKYKFLSVSFLYKSVWIVPFSMEQEVSRNGRDFLWLQLHLSSWSFGEVWLNVNLIWGWIWFNFSINSWNFFVVPLHTRNKSSKKRFMKINESSPFCLNFFAVSIIFGSTFLAKKILAYETDGTAPIAQPIIWMNSSWLNSKILYCRITSKSFIMKSVGTLLSVRSSRASLQASKPSDWGIFV